MAHHVLLISPAEVRAHVRDRLAPQDAWSLAWISATLHRLTAGWQTLVEHALTCGMDPWEADEDPLAYLSRRDSPARRWIDQHLVPNLTREAAELLRLAQDLDPFPRELVAELRPDSLAAYDVLRDQSLIGADSRGALRVVPLIAAVTANAPATEVDDWFEQAAGWYDDARMPGSALRAARHSGDLERCQRLIERCGDVLIGGGWSDEVLHCLDLLEPGDLSIRARLIWGHASRAVGRSTEALRILEGVRATTSEGGETPPADLVWRLAQCYYSQGNHALAAACSRGELVPVARDEPPRDRARRLALLASTLHSSGDIADAVRAADEAVAAADECGTGIDDACAGATARLVQAILMRGARRQNRMTSVLADAEATGDLFLVKRALTNLSHLHLVAAEYPEARETARRAIDLADRTGPVGCFSVALHNEGEALLALGDLRSARTRFRECLDRTRCNGQGRTPAPLVGLAECEYQSGRLGDAQAAFEEAVEVAREWGDLQVLVPALCRLATILATQGTECSDEALLSRAVGLADEAVRLASPDQEPSAALARGWVAMAIGEDDVRVRAESAVESTQRQQVRRALGEALELQAAVAGPGREARELLQSAIEVHELSGAACFADRVRVTLADLPGATREQQTAGRAAARRLCERGFSSTPLHPGRRRPRAGLSIRVLGSFAVLTDGVPIPTAAWRSRQARTLLKLLVARQGRPLCRGELCETLWPGDDDSSARHRLSVLLSSLRSTLDPGRGEPTDHFIVVGESGLRLREEHVRVDLPEFLADAREAARLADGGEEAQARQLLSRTLSEHPGDPFEDDPYEVWALEARDQVRAVRVQSLRLAARLAGRAGCIDEAVTWLEQLLALDPYDEPAHRLLVAVLVRSRRYGAARGAFDRWSRANREIGVPEPDPGMLAADALETGQRDPVPAP